MYCAQCGTQVKDNQKYCNRCGQPVGGSAAADVVTPPPPPYTGSSPAAYGAATPRAMPTRTAARSRVACHLRMLGILWIVVSAMRLLPALGLLVFSHMGRMDFPFVPSQFRFFMMPMLGGLGVFLSAARRWWASRPAGGCSTAGRGPGCWRSLSGASVCFLFRSGPRWAFIRFGCWLRPAQTWSTSA